MNLLKSILQVIAGILILIVPFVIIYEVLLTINLEPTEGLVSLFAMFLEPFISILRIILGEKTIQMGNFDVDLLPPIFCAVLIAISTVLTIVIKIITSVQSSMNYVTAKTKVHIAQKQQEEEKREQDKRMMANSVGYVVVRFRTQTTSSAYLLSSGLSADDIKNKFIERFNKYNYYDAKLQSESQNDNYILIFDEVPGSITYTLTLQDNMKSLNDELDKAGVKLSLTCGIFCAAPTDSKPECISIANKVCNLAGPGDVTCSKTVKDIYEKDRAEHTLKFNSKGMYDLGSEIEIFTVARM